MRCFWFVTLLGSLHGNRDVKGGAFSRLTIKADLSFCQVNTFFYNGKTQSGAFYNPYIFGPEEPFKDLIVFGLGNSDSFIFNGSVKGFIFIPKSEVNLPVLFGVFNRIRKQILKDLIETFTVGDDDFR